MRRVLPLICVRAGALLLSFGVAGSSVIAQSSEPTTAAKRPAAFEAADVHPSPYSFWGKYFRWSLPSGDTRFTARQASLLDLITTAYEVRPDNVAGSPPWLDFDRFEITAKVPKGTDMNTAKLMLRALLEDRFKLAVNTDVKPLPAMLLVKDDKAEPKLRPAADTSSPGFCRYMMTGPAPKPGDPPPDSYSLECRNMTTSILAKMMENIGLRTGLPVVDSTGLNGTWDFVMTLPRQNASGDGMAAIADAIQKQLGLKLQRGVSPQPVLTIVKINEQPTPNLPNVADLLPPPVMPEFEVATVKPAAPGGPRQMQTRWKPNGEVDIYGATLQELMAHAFDISGAMISEMPPWFSRERWDITGKANPDAFPKAANGTPIVNYDDIQLMLRGLLKERFALQWHTESRPADTYVLLTGTPKLKKADPTRRTYCDWRPPAGEKDARAANPARAESMYCQNVTVAQFAAELQNFARDYIKSPVVNSAKLDGTYDIALNWSDSRTARGILPGGAQRPPDDPNQPSDPTGAISLPDAIAKQLGLKLEIQKLPAPMLVVEHLNETPTEN